MTPSRLASPFSVLLGIGMLLPLFTAPALEAQTGSGDAMAFPRQVLTWYLAGEADQVWKHADGPLRELAGSPAGLKQAATEISSDLGPHTAVLKEQVFPHPEGGGWHVFVRALRHAQVPEMFWIVIFSPAEQKVQMIMAQPRQTIRTLFPQVILP